MTSQAGSVSTELKENVRRRGHGVLTVGATAVLVSVLLDSAAWIMWRPDGQPTARLVGEVLGSLAILLLSWTLILATVRPSVERAFGGLDRLGQWHRGLGETATVLVFAHVPLAESSAVAGLSGFGAALGDIAAVALIILTVWAIAPSLRTGRWLHLVRFLGRLPYERWLTVHRFAGVFVAVAAAHALVVDPVLAKSLTLRVIFVAIAAIGVLAYLYREFVAPFTVPVYQYVVAHVDRPNASTIEIALRPLGAELSFAAGQFIMLAFGGAGRWQRHPFTVSSSPTDPLLRVAVKASGDFTKGVYDQIEPGVPARIVGPYGNFDFRDGGHRQIWVAGGIGVTPFLSWIRAGNAFSEHDIDLIYSVDNDESAAFADEVLSMTTPTFRTQLCVTERDGRITADTILAREPQPVDTIFMCGPPAMMTSLEQALIKRGVRRDRIRWEHFDLR